MRFAETGKHWLRQNLHLHLVDSSFERTHQHSRCKLGASPGLENDRGQNLGRQVVGNSLVEMAAGWTEFERQKLMK